MKDMNLTPENLELVSITYSNEAVFEKESSRLTSHAYDELERVARMIGRLPQTAVHVEIRLDGDSIDRKRHLLWRQRFQAIQDALVGKGVEASRIHTHADTVSQTLYSEITLSLTTMNSPLYPMIEPRGLCYNGWGCGCQTY